MATHKLTIDLSPAAFAAMQQSIASGEFDSESDFVEAALLDFAYPIDEGLTSAPWTREEIKKACEEDEASPNNALSVQQVREHLKEKRKALSEAA